MKLKEASFDRRYAALRSARHAIFALTLEWHPQTGLIGRVSLYPTKGCTVELKRGSKWVPGRVTTSERVADTNMFWVTVQTSGIQTVKVTFPGADIRLRAEVSVGGSDTQAALPPRTKREIDLALWTVKHGASVPPRTPVRKVSTLELFNRRIREIPSTIDLFCGLERLYLNGNRIQELPGSLGRLENLKLLDLNGNRCLTALPDSLCDLSRLEQLFVGGNALKFLPRAIGNLQSLRVLAADDNRIVTLPKSMRRLKKLEDLALNNNSLTSLPKDLAKLPALRILRTSGNPFKGGLARVVHAGHGVADEKGPELAGVEVGGAVLAWLGRGARDETKEAQEDKREPLPVSDGEIAELKLELERFNLRSSAAPDKRIVPGSKTATRVEANRGPTSKARFSKLTAFNFH